MSLELLERMIAADEGRKKQDDNPPAPENKVDDSNSENVDTKSNDDPGSDSKDNADTSKNENGDKQESKTPNDKTDQNKIDKSKLGDKEKMEYSFRKQFAKQEGKFRSQLEQMQKELEELKKGTKKPEVTRDNFESDEAYTDWKLEQKANDLFEQHQKKELENKIAEQNALKQRETVVNKVQGLFDEPEELKLYNTMVKYAIDNGFDDALKHENGKDIKKFIDNSPIGPRVLQHLIGFPDKFNEIFNMDDSVDKKVELKMLERELQHDIMLKKSKKASNIDNKDSKQTQTKPNVPVIGKLGVNSSNTNMQLSKTEEDREMLKYIRGR